MTPKELSSEQSASRQLVECEEALRSTQAEFAAFREQMLEPIKAAEGESVESLSWDELLGVAVRNLNLVIDLDGQRALLREALTELMYHARAYLEPGGSRYGNVAMATARAALEKSRT